MTQRRKDDRTVIRIGGGDARKFLQDLVTNDIGNKGDALVYAALLTPQGKYLFDFFLWSDGDDLMLDVSAARAAALVQRLTMYRLRADVSIGDSGLAVWQVLGDRPDGPHVFADPRDGRLGWRLYADTEPCFAAAPLSDADWTALRIEHAVPETEVELIADETYILEAGFDRLNGVDFRKGCFVGQEVTARMRHKTELRKGLMRVEIDGEAETGTPILNGGRSVGTLYSLAGNQGLAHLRFDRLDGALTAGSAKITPRE